MGYGSRGNPPVARHLSRRYLSGSRLGWRINCCLPACGCAGCASICRGSAGIGHFFGPTGGYLIAFPIGAVIVGAVVHRGLERRDPSTVSPLVLVGGMTLATAVIYALGVTQLSLVLELSPWEAVMAGAVPFIPWELLEMGMVLVIINAVNIAIE
ncbi:MAG: biotin transporter BioY [Natrialbaceae archaeon]|nr:biotin transporter BioY [Natrialbaceae archaeon]